jgi:hypothetical protein
VQEHLGRQLRATYVEAQDRPVYLGDPALPPQFDEHLYRLAARESPRERARLQGLAAVAAALAVETHH